MIDAPAPPPPSRVVREGVVPPPPGEEVPAVDPVRPMQAVAAAGICFGVGILGGLSGIAFICAGVVLLAMAGARAVTLIWRGR